jgi:hypothetical protein
MIISQVELGMTQMDYLYDSYYLGDENSATNVLASDSLEYQNLTGNFSTSYSSENKNSTNNAPSSNFLISNTNCNYSSSRLLRTLSLPENGKILFALI